MIQTPLDSPVCTDEIPVPATVPACAPPREPLKTPSSPTMLPMGLPSKPDCAAATCSVLRMSNFTTYLVLFSLPMRRNLRAASGSPRLYASANSFNAGPRFARSRTWKLADDNSTSPKSAMLFGVNFCMNVALLRSEERRVGKEWRYG